MRSNTELRVSLILEESVGLQRVSEPVTVGLPFRQGMVFDPSSLTLWDVNNHEFPLQAYPLEWWFDGSVKWILLDFQAGVEANARTIYQLRCATGKSTGCPSPVLSVRETSEGVVIDTGKATFFINRQLCKPFDRLIIEGAEFIATQGSSLVLTDKGGQTYLPYIDDLAVETKGQLRVTIRARGEFRAPSCAGLGRFVTGLSLFSGS